MNTPFDAEGIPAGEMLVKLTQCEQRCKANQHRIDRLERDTEALTRLACSVEVLAHEQKNTVEKLASVDRKVEALEAVPARRYHALWGYLAAGAVSALCGVLGGLLTALLA